MLKSETTVEIMNRDCATSNLAESKDEDQPVRADLLLDPVEISEEDDNQSLKFE